MSIVKFEFSYDTVSGEFSVVNTETGEAKISKVSKKKKVVKKDESSTPKLILEDNKYSLNSAAVELLQVEPDDKLDIKYEKQGKNIIPVIGTDESFGTHGGNRLTKSFTVTFRGSKNEELAKYGIEFTLIPHDSKNGIFILKNEDSELEQSLNTAVEKSVISNEEIELPMDIDLQDLIDDPDAEITEVDSSLFKL